MRKSTKIDRYLTQLEGELADMPADARARVMADVRAQINKGLAQKRTPTAVLRDVGPAKLIAMSHMKIRDGRGRTSPWVRYTAFATVGLFGLILGGGLWWIFRSKERIKSRNLPEAAAASRAMVEGDFNLSLARVKNLRIEFNVGKLELTPGTAGELKWVCAGAPKLEVVGTTLTFAPDQGIARCELAMPPEVPVRVSAANGHLDVRQPRYPYDIELVNGRVSVTPDPARAYDYQVQVKNGLQDFFRGSPKPGALKVKINVVNGSVKKE